MQPVGSLAHAMALDRDAVKARMLVAAGGCSGVRLGQAVRACDSAMFLSVEVDGQILSGAKGRERGPNSGLRIVHRFQVKGLDVDGFLDRASNFHSLQVSIRRRTPSNRQAARGQFVDLFHSEDHHTLRLGVQLFRVVVEQDPGCPRQLQESTGSEGWDGNAHAWIQEQIAQAIEMVVPGKVWEQKCMLIEHTDKSRRTATMTGIVPVADVGAFSMVPGSCEQRFGILDPTHLRL